MANVFRGGPRPRMTGPRPSRAGRAHAQASRQVQSIRATQREISKLIRELQKKLERAKKNRLETEPMLTFKRISNVADLRGDSVSFHDALRKDIKKLRAQLRMLNAAESKAIRRPALRAGKAFKARALVLIRIAENDRTGTLDGEELESLQRESDGVVNMWSRTLRQAPTTKNIESAVKALVDAAVIGADCCEKGFEAITYASGKLLSDAENNFRARATSANLEKALEAEAFDQLVGGEGDLFGGRIGKGTPRSHTVGPGDTLSGLAQRYYGDMGQWDIIYFHNYGAIDGDPNTLRQGVVLEIPPLALH